MVTQISLLKGKNCPTSLTESRKFSLYLDQKPVRNESEDLFEVLQRWSEKLNHMSVLILDNCDDILASSTHDTLLKLIDTLVKLTL